MRVSRLGVNAAWVIFCLGLVVLLANSTPAAAQFYNVTLLTADQSGIAPNTDANLINPWGMAYTPTGPFWVSDNNSGLSTLYDGNGVPQSLVVTIPSADGVSLGTPTGIVYNPSGQFMVKKGTKAGSALFLFVTEDGTISGWAPNVDAVNAVIALDNSSQSAVYKGMEIANNAGTELLYVANFFAGSIEVYDGNFTNVTPPGSFVDPNLPAGFAPHNIHLIGSKLYVAYAMQNADKTDAVIGPHLGYVSVFSLNGKFLKRFASKGPLNAPWGLVKATASFGVFSNDILVGNLGNGHITAYDPVTKAKLGQLTKPNGKPVAISGLWGLMFGNGWQGQGVNTLFFTAGPGNYAHGRFGSINAQ